MSRNEDGDSSMILALMRAGVYASSAVLSRGLQWARSFNVADSAISIGAVLLIADELRRVRCSK